MAQGRKLRLEVGGHIIDLGAEVASDQITISTAASSPTVVEVRSAAADRGYLLLGGEVVPYYFVRQGPTVQLWVRGRTYRMELKPEEAKAAAAHSDGRVVAPMPGTVFQVLVAPGAMVENQQPVVIMESMKMELTVPAPMAGRVAEVLCKPGQLVDTGLLLVRLEAAGG